MKEIIAGLDIGTTKVCAVIAERTEDKQLKIVGIGTAECEGLRFGMVVDIKKTVQAITGAFEEARLMAGVSVKGVYVGISGDHIRSNNYRGVVTVSRAHSEITVEDVNRAIEAARAACLPTEREIIHVIPTEYKVDDQGGICNPIGMCGVHLEVEIHIVTAAPTSVQNLVKCIHLSGFEIYDLVLSSLAASYAVLSDDEKELGISLVDIGGGTTDIALFSGGSVRHTSVLGLAGDNLTNTISIGLRTSTYQARKIKEKYGCAVPSAMGDKEMFDVPSASSTHPVRQVSCRLLASIIKPRLEEIIGLAFRQIEGSNVAMNAGVVLTGGTANLKGIEQLCEDITGLSVRIGRPAMVAGLDKIVDDPKFATAVGLVLWGARHMAGEGRFAGGGSSILSKTLNQLRQWMHDLW